MKLGDALIMMGRPAAGYRNPKRLGQATQSLYINVKGVDKHFQRARKAVQRNKGLEPSRPTARAIMSRRRAVQPNVRPQGQQFRQVR